MKEPFNKVPSAELSMQNAECGMHVHAVMHEVLFVSLANQSVILHAVGRLARIARCLPATDTEGQARTQHHEAALRRVKQHLRQPLVHDALVLGEAVDGAPRGVGVEELQRRVQHPAMQQQLCKCGYGVHSTAVRDRTNTPW
jgi:hypothetical protein